MNNQNKKIEKYFKTSMVEDQDVIPNKRSRLSEIKSSNQFDSPINEIIVSNNSYDKTPIKALNISETEHNNSIDSCRRVLFLKEEQTSSKYATLHTSLCMGANVSLFEGATKISLR
uniref:Uncharacterized protein n=1 Tax=Vespula pensylvanica TaxID=30213 RepID=A0A834KVA2_VESPE|nr:hypothetical protein H0235_013428 [Vespula pensylvanica]